MSDLHYMGVKEVLAAYQQGLSPVELVTHLLERIDRVDPAINCVVDTLPDLALAEARAAEAVLGNASDKPLLGVPFLLKEQHNLGGYSATRGSQTLTGAVAPADDPIIARLRAAGAIPLGRTTTPELSCATFSHTREWGVSRNPFNPHKTPGGSSGGSGGSVAAGFAPFATASDIAGSTRIPAAFNGLPGFKAPFGSTPGTHPSNNDWYRGDHVLARSVADTAYVFNTITGLHPFDHATVPVAPLPHTFGDPESLLAGKRIAISPDLGGYALDGSVAQGVDRVAQALANAGATVETVNPGLNLADITRASMSHLGHIFGAKLYQSVNGDLSGFEPYTRLMVEMTTQAARETSLVDSLTLESQIQDSLTAAMAGFDVLVTATSAIEDLDADNDYLGPVDRESGQLGFYWEGHMTVPFNIANRMPVMAMPSGIGSAGVPTSVQLVGHPYASTPVLEVAAALEQLLPAPRPEL